MGRVGGDRDTEKKIRIFTAALFVMAKTKKNLETIQISSSRKKD